MHDKYVYEAKYPGGTMDQLSAIIKVENMQSKIDS